MVLQIYNLATLRFEEPRVDNRSFNSQEIKLLQIQRLNSTKENQDWYFAIQNTSITLVIVAQSFIFVVLTTRVASKSYEEVNVPKSSSFQCT